VLRVHAFEDEKVDRCTDEFGLGGAEREVGQIGASCSANMPLNTERERCTAAFFASGNLSAVVFSPTSLPISYMRKSAAAMSRARATIPTAAREGMWEW